MESHSFDSDVPQGHGPLGYGQEFGQHFINPNILHQQIHYVPIQWLDAKQNWPENAERMLTEFMVHHHFYNYNKTKAASNINLNTITANLSELFDPLEWVHDTHEKKLKNKVINKIHRIRRQHLPRGTIDFRIAFAKVVSDDYDEILQIVFDKVGLAKMKAFLTARDQTQESADGVSVNS